MCLTMAGSRTWHSVSTRRSRLRSIRSALPMYSSRRRRSRSSTRASARGTGRRRSARGSFADAGDARPEAADAADDQVDVDARLGRAVERANDAGSVTRCS